MRGLASIGVWFLAAAYAASLVAAVDATLGAGGVAGRLGPDTIVLAPLEGDPVRSVETRVGGVHVRRMCAAGRCELLVGRGGGYELLASYPADRWVELEGGDHLRLRELGSRTRPALRAMVAPRWILAGLLGAFLAGILLGRGRRLRARVAQLRRSRPAVVEDGALHFTDAAVPRRALPCEPMRDGPATGLREAWRERGGGDAPYRDAVTARWVTLAGDRDQNLARAAASWGAHLALGVAVSASTLIAIGVALTS